VLEIERGDVQYLFRRRPNLMARIQQRAKLSYDASWAAIGALSEMYAELTLPSASSAPYPHARRRM